MSDEFIAWRIAPARAHARADVPAVGGRLQASVALSIHDADNPADQRTRNARFELLGPLDVVRLAPGVIRRRYPQPGAQDAEETKTALIEFDAAHLDLPWRYTPEVHASQLRPWLALMVGAPEDLTLLPDGNVVVSTAVQAAHPLASSWRCAHVHRVDGVDISRLLSPIDLQAHRSYVAALVPAFRADAAGAVVDAWDGSAPVTLRCFDSWAFTTGEEGDFLQLASALRAIRPDDLGSVDPDTAFGRAQLHYDRRSPGEPRRAALPTAGALQRPSAADDPEVPPAPWIQDETAALSTPIPVPAGRWVLTAPRYAAAYRPVNDPTPAAGWRADLDRDPRHRGAAGLGLWSGIAWQEKIAAAASKVAGDLAIARDRIAHLGLGLEASRSLWRRRMPDDPVAQLAVLGPVLARLPSANGIAIDAVTGRTPGLVRALWSSAARRCFRTGPARTTHAEPGANRLDAVLRLAGQCPNPPREPDEIPLHGRVPERLARQVDQAELSAVRDAMSALSRERPRCRPVDMGDLGKRIAAAVDPTVARPVIVERVLGTLPGLADIGVVEIEPELDLPVWSFLCDCAPDWLLPGIGALPQDRVMALATNPAFVEAMLAGANHQALSELRWRNLPIRSGWSPMRKFWQRTQGEMDIVPIRGWPDASTLGGPGLQPVGIGVEGVVVFRTRLFHRYPGTVVYLYDKLNGTWQAPADNEPVDPSRKTFPSFSGVIGDDIAFFGFPKTPQAMAGCWVVLEEPPSGYRFYTEKPNGTQFPDHTGDLTWNAARFAHERFALPVRVMIGQLTEAL
ncbi:hypothetical protein [Pseudoxanthomonas putridarboris]|uniref:DUF2169 domain-containing protein n=1 Tax=Pseudoxanthomonas putridarboris TaxID=752605 RepID=A0ABU9IZP2_9GAMM